MTSVGHDIVVKNTFRSLMRHRGHHGGRRIQSQEMLTLPEHMFSPLVFIDVHVVLSFVSPYFML